MTLSSPESFALAPCTCLRSAYHFLRIVPFYESEKEEDAGYLKK